MLRFDVNCSSLPGSFTRSLVCYRTNKPFSRRTSFLELRQPISHPYQKRKQNFFQFTYSRTSRPRFLTPIFAEYNRWPFRREDYKRVKFHIVRMLSESPASGTVLLIEDTYGESGSIEKDPDPKGLMIQVGGDSFLGILYYAAGRETERPMTVNLLNTILERIEELNPMDWHLLHVAVVGIRNNTFIGRMFFGNPETGEIVWDCDCRPSDACLLSLKKMCPIYVQNGVWHNCAQSLQKVFSDQYDVRSSLESMAWATEQTATRKPGADPFTSIIASDPTVIKRLKREMSVAVTEEDYSTAARIRDHPYMKKYKSMVDLRKEGKYEEASQIEDDLRQQISKDDSNE